MRMIPQTIENYNHVKKLQGVVLLVMCNFIGNAINKKKKIYIKKKGF